MASASSDRTDGIGSARSEASSSVASQRSFPVRSPGRDARPVCRFYNTASGCRFGTFCRNRHVDPDRSPEATLAAAYGIESSPGETSSETTAIHAPSLDSRTIPCRYWASGTCRFGSSCHFKHDAADILVSVAESSQVGKSPLLTSDGLDSTSLSSSLDKLVVSSASEISSEPAASACMICFEEEPTTYGLLPACSHSFCLDCIRSWRDSSSKDAAVVVSGVIKMCPACRTPNKFVVPSKYFYVDGDVRKIQTIDGWKERMALIPCRHLQRNPQNPFCPFGMDCFYSHKKADGTFHVFTHGAEELEARARHQAQRRELNRLRRALSDADFFFESFSRDRDDVGVDDTMLDYMGDLVSLNMGLEALRLSDDEDEVSDWETEDGDDEEEEEFDLETILEGPLLRDRTAIRSAADLQDYTDMPALERVVPFNTAAWHSSAVSGPWNALEALQGHESDSDDDGPPPLLRVASVPERWDEDSDEDTPTSAIFSGGVPSNEDTLTGQSNSVPVHHNFDANDMPPLEPAFPRTRTSTSTSPTATGIHPRSRNEEEPQQASGSSSRNVPHWPNDHEVFTEWARYPETGRFDSMSSVFYAALDTVESSLVASPHSPRTVSGRGSRPQQATQRSDEDEEMPVLESIPSIGREPDRQSRLNDTIMNGSWSAALAAGSAYGQRRLAGNLPHAHSGAFRRGPTSQSGRGWQPRTQTSDVTLSASPSRSTLNDRTVTDSIDSASDDDYKTAPESDDLD